MKRHTDKLLAIIIAVMAFMLIYVWAWEWGYSAIETVALSQDERPYVYRVLIPLLARALSSVTDQDLISSMLVITVFSSIALFYALRQLYQTFHPGGARANTVAFLGYLLIYIVTLYMSKPYDMPTALFFTLSISLLAQRKYTLYYMLFVIATINRETTFLLILFFVVYAFLELPRTHFILGTLYQSIIFLVIRSIITNTFASNPGAPFLWNMDIVLNGYARHPLATAILLAFTALFIAYIFRSWNKKPRILRVAFVVIFPVQLILHVLMGMPFEIRVFVESLPIMIALASTHQTVRQECASIKIPWGAHFEQFARDRID